MWRSKHHIDYQKLDRFGEELLNALEPTDNDINVAATSPFLYRRILVRIEAEERRRSEERFKWIALLAEAKHAIPALAMIAIVAIGLVWYSPSSNNQVGTPNGASLTITGIGIPGLSSDDVISSLVEWNERKEQQ
jgi:hypothetical protein